MPVFRPSHYSGYAGAVDDLAAQFGVSPEDAGAALRTFAFGESARVEAEQLRDQIRQYYWNAEQGTFPGKSHWLKQAQGAEAKLKAIEVKAGEEKFLAQSQAAATLAITMMATLGVAAVGIFVYTQYTRAQIQREELKRLRGR